MFFVYIIENLVNGKSYVGQTKDPDFRWRKHRKKGSGTPYIYRALKKYGKDNFLFSIIEGLLTLDEAYTREKFWISELKTITPDGYNLKEGGLGGGYLSEEGRKKHSESIQGENNPFFGKKHGDESKKAISEAKKGRPLPLSEEERQRRRDHMRGREVSAETREKLSKASRSRDCATWTGKRHSEETKRKMSEAQKNRYRDRKLSE